MNRRTVIGYAPSLISALVLAPVPAWSENPQAKKLVGVTIHGEDQDGNQITEYLEYDPDKNLYLIQTPENTISSIEAVS